MGFEPTTHATEPKLSNKLSILVLWQNHEKSL